MTPAETHKIFYELLFSDIFFGICCVASWVGLELLNKYEFDHRTDGGVVKFNSYASSRLHGIKVGMLRTVRKICGVLFLLLGVCVLIGFATGANRGRGKNADADDNSTRQERSVKKNSHKSSHSSDTSSQNDTGSK